MGRQTLGAKDILLSWVTATLTGHSYSHGSQLLSWVSATLTGHSYFHREQILLLKEVWPLWTYLVKGLGQGWLLHLGSEGQICGCCLESVGHVVREPGLPEEDAGPARPDLAIRVIHTPLPLGLLMWDPTDQFFIQGLIRAAWLARTASLCFVPQGTRALSTQAQDDKRPIEATEAYSSCPGDQGPALDSCQRQSTS